MADRARLQWARALELGALATVLAFLALLAYVLLLGGAVDSGHGGGSTMGHMANATMDANASTMAHGANGAMGTSPSHTGSTAAQGPPSFLRSFGLLGLALSATLLAGVGLWASVRRDWTLAARHVAAAGTLFVLVVLFLNARGGFAFDAHSWNESFADASVILFAATLAIGPLARLWKAASPAVAWRRELGVWATVAAAIHVGIYWGDALGWAQWGYFFYPDGARGLAPTLAGDRDAGAVPMAFNVANVVGVVALAYAIVLAVTSNDAAQRWLKSGWSWLQDRATTMWLLVLLHAWAFAYYITGGTLVLGTLWASFWLVLLLQTGAFAKTVWLRPKPASAAGP